MDRKTNLIRTEARPAGWIAPSTTIRLRQNATLHALARWCFLDLHYRSSDSTEAFPSAGSDSWKPIRLPKHAQTDSLRAKFARTCCSQSLCPPRFNRLFKFHVLVNCSQLGAFDFETLLWKIRRARTLPWQGALHFRARHGWLEAIEVNCRSPSPPWSRFFTVSAQARQARLLWSNTSHFL